MLRGLYVHHFRCLENFELPALNQSSILLIGNNGSGRTTEGRALEVLQKIARGTNRVDSLVKPKDLTRGLTDVPVRFEIDADLGGETYEYAVAFDLPKGSKKLRVMKEKLSVGGRPVYTREQERVKVARSDRASIGQMMMGPSAYGSEFEIDCHLVALSIIQEQSLSVFKQWLARMLILRPVPALIAGDSNQETLGPNLEVTDYGAWFSGLLAHAPAAYSKIDSYLKQVMPDFMDITNPQIGKDSRTLVVQFRNGQGTMTVPFEDLSNGEKCFMICALVLAANEADSPLLCFWDEPDNYLALSEVGHFVVALRKAFQAGGQFIATSHNPEAIRRFSNENTLYLHRKSHLEPTIARRLDELQVAGDLVAALVRGDLEP